MTRMIGSLLAVAVASGMVSAQEPSVQVQVQVQEQMERAHEAMVQAQERMADVHINQEMIQEQMARAQEKMQDMHFDFQFQLQEPMLLAQKFEKEELKGPWRVRGRSYDLYNRGMDALDRRDYERARTTFDEYYRVNADQKDSRADGALYWKAYALNKLGRRDDSLASLAQLEKSYPSSRWLNDARALQLEVKQGTGQGTSPEGQSEEDLKLLAINSLANTDSERTLPLLEKLLADPKASPRLKERALFVLAQGRNPKAGEIIARYAKGAGNPDVQVKAVEYLGVFGSKANMDLLASLYGSTSDPSIKRAVIRGYMIGKDKDHLLAAAKSEQNPDLRQEAVRGLGAVGAQAELASMYSGESNAEVKRAIIQSLSMKREKGPELLAGMYAGESDKNLKKEILHSLRNQGAAKMLVDIARKETDPSLKQEAVRDLSMMRSKEAQDYMVELLSK